jgi:NADPH2:quinone reductase
MLTPMLQDLPDARRHQGEILRYCAQLVETGKLRPRVEETLPLEAVARAHRAIEEGHVQGKIVLQMPET